MAWFSGGKKPKFLNRNPKITVSLEAPKDNSCKQVEMLDPNSPTGYKIYDIMYEETVKATQGDGMSFSVLTFNLADYETYSSIVYNTGEVSIAFSSSDETVDPDKPKKMVIKAF